MKVLHVPFTYFPSSCGGTEVYVAALCRELALLGVSSLVAAPGEASAEYEHQNVRVRRLPVQRSASLAVMNGDGDPVAAEAFDQVLHDEMPDVVHFHAFSPAVSVRCLEAANKRGIPCVYTFHTATTTCARGTLMRWGTEPCDGEMRPFRCSACSLHGHSMPKLLALMVSALSPITQVLAPLLPDTARWQTTACAAPLAARRREKVKQWFKGMKAVIGLSEWSCRLMELNGVPIGKTHLVRHGLPTQYSADTPAITKPESKAVRLVFIGRLDPIKGVHLLLSALAADPALPVQLDLYALVTDSSHPYVRGIMNQITMDPRVTLRQPIPPEAMVQTLSAYDLLVVPSQALETGPLVVLEAFAAGVPVLGSALGGIAEWVRDGIDGMLVKESSPAAWLDALRLLVLTPNILRKFQDGIRVPPTFSRVAEETRAVYFGIGRNG